MKKLCKYMLWFGGPLVAFICGLAFFSCTKQLPTVPTIQQTPDTFQLTRGGGRGGRGGGKEIGKEGGTIEILVEKDTCFLVVPSGALDSTVFISASANVKTTSNGYSYVNYQFGPDGLKFSKPATLKHYAKLSDGIVLNCYWLVQ